MNEIRSTVGFNPFTLQYTETFNHLKRKQITGREIVETKEIDLPVPRVKKPVVYGPSMIIKKVCELYGVTEQTLFGPSNNETVTKAKCLVAWVLRNNKGLPYAIIANAICRDSSTVRGLNIKANGLLQHDLQFLKFKNQLLQIINE